MNERFGSSNPHADALRAATLANKPQSGGGAPLTILAMGSATVTLDTPGPNSTMWGTTGVTFGSALGNTNYTVLAAIEGAPAYYHVQQKATEGFNLFVWSHAAYTCTIVWFAVPNA
jgi:hypothetical protein